MRSLVLLVLAEFLLLLVLAMTWLSGTATAAPAVAPAPVPRPANVVAAPVVSTSATPSIERSEVAPTVPDVTAGDPLGILVSGHVRSSEGALVDGASVYFRRDGEYHMGNSATPGCYAATGLVPGEWKLTCRAEGFANHEITCTLDARAFQQIDIELQPSYAVRVKILGADGKSIIEELSRQDPFGVLSVVATETPLTEDLPPTEQRRLSRFGVGEWRGVGDFGQEGKQLREQGFGGELRLDRPPPVHAALLLRTTLLQSQRIEPGQQELVFTTEVGDVLAKFGTVKLRLLNGVTGEPIRGVRVSLSTAQGGGAGGKTDDEGRVTIERALPGLVCLQLTASKDLESLFRYVRVPSAGVTDLGDITLNVPVKVTGVVVGASGKPENGATVQWTELDGRTFPQPLAGRRSVAADAEGKFELWGCGRHRYVVFAQARDGAFGFATVDATGGAPAPVSIALTMPTKVALRTNFDTRVGYVVTALANDRSPVAVATLGSEYRPESIALPPGSYTIEIHDMMTDRLVRSFPLQVGSVPLSIDVP